MQRKDRIGKYKTVLVTWIDSASHGDGWEYRSKMTRLGEGMDIESVGFLMQEDKKAIVVCPHLTDSEDNDWQGIGVMTIPKCSVKSMRVLYRKETGTQNNRKKKG